MTTTIVDQLQSLDQAVVDARQALFVAIESEDTKAITKASKAVADAIAHRKAEKAEYIESINGMPINPNVECIDQAHGDRWSMLCGDSIRLIDALPDNSIDFSVFSPPFPGMYVYSDLENDMGNCINLAGAIEHFRYLMSAQKMLRVIKPGREVAIHLQQMPIFKNRAGYKGLQDYRGDTIRMMQECGWIYYGETLIDKCPQLQSVRNNDQCLQFRSLASDASFMRSALAEYVLFFKKPGDNQVPIAAGISEKYGTHETGWITETEWIEWAAPVWYRHISPSGKVAAEQPNYPSLSAKALQQADDKQTINGILETDVLNIKGAKSTEDERHLCPLALCLIERAIKLKTNPGETVLTPFLGVGSEVYQALKLNRRAIGFELKKTYFNQAVKNINLIENNEQLSLLDLLLPQAV